MRGIGTSSCIVMLTVAASAYAQTGTAPNNQAGTPLTSPAQAGLSGQTDSLQGRDASTGAGELDTIVVTAQRRQENLQNVPIAVAVISPSQLANSGITNLQELSLLVPGIQTAVSASASDTYLRGVGSQAFGPGVESPIALYIDGVYYASEFGAPAEFLNVDQVEVLKGPQGTLFGRNATGGLVQITTKTPSAETHVDADFSYGDYNTSKLDLYATTGIAEDLAADVAIKASHQGDGYGRNITTGEDAYRTDLDVGIRSKWLYTPAAGTSLTLIFDYNQIRTTDNALQVQPGSALPPQLASPYSNSPYEISANLDPLLYHKDGGVSAHLVQDLSFGQLVNTVAYRRSYTLLDLDIDETAIPYEGATIIEDEHQITEELQLLSAHDSLVSWTGGLFYFYDRAADAPTTLALDPDPTVDPVPPLTGLMTSGIEGSESVAGYGQATAEVLPATNLTLGARYTWERRTLSDTNQTGLIGPVTIPILTNYSASKDYTRPTYRGSLDHRFSPEILTYASVSTGFKSGGFNVASPTDPAYEPEKLVAYAIGMKNDLLDRRLRVNAEGFYYNYTDIQVVHPEPGAPGISNGASAHIYGLDVDAEAQVTSALQAHGGSRTPQCSFRFLSGCADQLSVGRSTKYNRFRIRKRSAFCPSCRGEPGGRLSL